MNIILEAAAVITSLTAIITALIAVLGPVKRLSEGLKCLLRSDMLSTYYNHLDEKTLRQYQRENFDYLYKAYKALHGNSFIDDVYTEIRDWNIIS